MENLSKLPEVKAQLDSLKELNELVKSKQPPFFKYEEDERADISRRNQHLKADGMTDEQIVAFGEQLMNEVDWIEDKTDNTTPTEEELPF